jgi:hypothetical protein
MSDQNTPLPLDGDQSENQVTDQNNQDLQQEVVDRGSQDQGQDTNVPEQGDKNVELSDGDNSQMSRSERHQARWAEKMADRLRSQAEQDAQYGKQLFSQDNDYQPLKYTDGEFDIDQLQQDRQQYGQRTFNEGVRQGAAFYEAERFADRLEVDIDKVMSKRDDIDEVTEKMLVESYLDKVGAREDSAGRLIIGNPNLRFRDFADAKLKEIDDLVQLKLSQSTKNIASQAARTGVRPNGATQAGVTALSDDDLIQKVREADTDTEEGKKLLAEMRRRTNQQLGVQ